jgi:uncharacterized protein RhaS with RHS repeats
VESDPIGLEGGINTYSYAIQNPIRYDDIQGLIPGAGVFFGGMKFYLYKELPVRRLAAYASASTECFMCVADCVVEFGKSQVSGLAAMESFERATQSIAEQFVKQGVRLVAKRVDLMSTVSDVGKAAVCTIDCYEK